MRQDKRAISLVYHPNFSFCLAVRSFVRSFVHSTRGYCSPIASCFLGGNLTFKSSASSSRAYSALPLCHCAVSPFETNSHSVSRCWSLFAYISLSLSLSIHIFCPEVFLFSRIRTCPSSRSRARGGAISTQDSLDTESNYPSTAAQYLYRSEFIVCVCLFLLLLLLLFLVCVQGLVIIRLEH